MKTSTLISEDQLIASAVDALVDRLGIMEASRFLSLASNERTESVKRHRAWQSKLDQTQYFDEIFGPSV